MKKQLFLIALISFSAASIIKGYAIHDAIEKGDIKLVQKIINTYGPEILGLVDVNRGTPLHYVARSGSLEIAELIIEEGGIKLLKIKDRWGDTPLHDAARYNQPKIAELIVENGGPELLEMENNNGDTPLLYAARTKSTATGRILLAAKKSADNTRFKKPTTEKDDTNYNQKKSAQLMNKKTSKDTNLFRNILVPTSR